MSKWLRKETAKGCPVHQMITDRASDKLNSHGVFSKQDVLNDLSLTAIADAIRWDYVREFLEDAEGCELVPLAESYFSATKKFRKENPIDIKPEKYLAQGHGKKTAGYCAVTADNDLDHLVIKRIEQRAKVGNGVAQALHNYVQAVESKRQALGLPPATGIEVLEHQQ